MELETNNGVSTVSAYGNLKETLLQNQSMEPGAIGPPGTAALELAALAYNTELELVKCHNMEASIGAKGITTNSRCATHMNA